MSAQGQVTDFLRSMKPEGDVLRLDPNKVALQTGVSREQVNKTLYNLKAHGRIELLRDDGGRAITGIKVIDLEPRQRGGARPRKNPGQVGADGSRIRQADPIESTRRVYALRTPALDEYARAKNRFESMRSDFGDLVEATFKENPYAEEGLRLRERLANIETQFIDLRREKEETEREYRSLRARKQAAIAAEVEANGTAVQHGD